MSDGVVVHQGATADFLEVEPEEAFRRVVRS
jgi:hypothetical protein